MAARVISLLPGATEIVFALGAGGQLVGRSHECDFPASAHSLPVCCQPRVDPHGSSASIDTQVKDLVGQGLSVFEVDVEAIRRLQPDIIITQTQCDVCAVSPADLQSALNEWTGKSPQLVSLAPERLDDLWTDIATVAEALDLNAAPLVGALKASLDETRAIAGRLEARPRTACIEWFEPLMLAGNWVPELVEAAGGEAVLSQAGAHSDWLEWGALTAADPDVVVGMPCGFTLPKTLEEWSQLRQTPAGHACGSLSAVTGGRTFAVDGHNFFNRPGPRLVDSASILQAIFFTAEGQPLPGGLLHSIAKISTASDLPLTSSDPIGRSLYMPLS